MPRRLIDLSMHLEKRSSPTRPAPRQAGPAPPRSSTADRGSGTSRLAMTINLADVGAFAGVDAAGERSIRFGLYLPGIKATDGFQVVVRIIHRDDRFDPMVPPVDVAMQWQPASEFDLWSVTTSLMP